MTQCQCGFEVQHDALEFTVTLPCPVCRTPMTIDGTSGAYVAGLNVARTNEEHHAWLELVHGLWRELHRFAIDATDDQWADHARWYSGWLARVPSFGCDCNAHFREMTTDPLKAPDWSSRQAFFRWSVDRHNEVNGRLGKPPVSYEEAARIHDVDFAN